jgi:CRP/FNR family transcriptional regulator, cyclic AMP receptor protein
MTATTMRRGAQRPISLLLADPALAQLLPPDRLDAARAGLSARVALLPVGEWDTRRLEDGARGEHLGLLMLSGVVAYETVMGGEVSTELLGPGDVLRPWALDAPAPLVARANRWIVLSECRAAVLDRDIAAQLGAWPEVTAVLFDRLAERARRLATTQAISQLTRVDRRVLALFWHLAERWGRVTPEGVLVPLTLSHRMLGQLVGARRPTVSTAVRMLADERTLTRRADGTWLLGGDAGGLEHDGEPLRVVPLRRRLLAPPVVREMERG